MDKTTNRKMVSAAIMVSILPVAIDTTIVTTAMPHIVKQLSGLKLISWVFAIYLLTTAITTPIYGKLADMFGRKPIFLFGMVLFVIGSMLSGAAQSMTQMSADTKIAQDVLEQLRSGMANSLHLVFVLVFALALIILLISIMLPSHKEIMSLPQAD